MTDLPEWMQPIIDGAESITEAEMAPFNPPPDGSARQGAVLILFGDGPGGPDLLLTERGHQMRSQPGQVSFPGGATDPGDDGPVGTALREAQEETGLDPAGVQIIASLPQVWLPPRNFAVTPVLAWWREESPVAVVDPIEVEAVLRVPLSHLLDAEHRLTVTHPLGYSSPGFLIGEDKDLLLWGFTALIIDRIFDHCGLTLPWDATVTMPLPESMLRVRQD